MPNPPTGPRLTDARFFTECLDTTLPGLEEVPAAVARGDFALARRLFAAEARASLQPERFLTVPREFRGLHFMRPDETVEEAAERILRLELVSCSTPHQFQGEVDWFLNPTYNQYKEWTWQLSRHPEWAVLAERYRASGDERFAEGFVKLFRSWVRQALVPEAAPGNATLCWRTIETGIRMGGAWQWALHSFYRSPHFTDDVLVDWYKSVWEHGWRLRHFHWTHNWFIMEMNGLAQVALLYPQFRAAAEWQAYAFAGLVRELQAQVYPDGVQFELSTNYHQVVIRNYEWLWDVYDAYGQPVPAAFGPILERMHRANVRLMMPDGRLPDLNDGRWASVADLVHRAVRRYPDRADFRWAFTSGQQGAPPAETSLAFPYAGWFVLRTGWEPDAVWAFFDGGPFGFAHQHEDKLSLLLHAYGRRLLTEAGNYAYDASAMRQYVLSTRAHNTVRVDGQDQNRRLTFDRDAVDLSQPAPALWQTGPTRDVVEAEYDEGYGPAAERVAAHRRRVVFLKAHPDLGPCLLVVDRLTPHDAARHTYEVLWHLDVGQVEADGLTLGSRDEGQANLTLLAAPPHGADLSLSVVQGQTEPEWQGWTALASFQGQYAAIPTAVYRLSAGGPVRLVTLLYPTPPGATCPVASVAASADPVATSVVLTLTSGATLTLTEEEVV